MIVEAVHWIKGRGCVVNVTYDADALPKAGRATLRRLSDGAVWPIRGVERWAVERVSWRGLPIGLLLPMIATVALNDVVEVVSA